MEGLSQDLFLLCLDEHNGNMRSAEAELGFAGAVLMELIDREYITVDEKKKVILQHNDTTGNSLQDEFLDRIAKAKRLKTLEDWVNILSSGIHHLPSRVAEPLVQSGVLSEEVHKTLGLFPSRRFHLNNPGRQSEVAERVRAILLKTREPNKRDLALISLANSMELVDHLLSREERKMVKKTLKELTSEEMMADAVGDAIAAMQAAVAISVVTSIATTSASTSGS